MYCECSDMFLENSPKLYNRKIFNNLPVKLRHLADRRDDRFVYYRVLY